MLFGEEPYAGNLAGKVEALERELWTDVDRLADLLASLADALRECGPGLLQGVCN